MAIAARRPADDRDASDYQTLFAAEPGAVAAPTAALHFTPDLMARLADRGWLADGALTAPGLAVVTAVEADTDRLALGPWQALGAQGCDRLAELLRPVRRAVVAAGEWPAGNPIGVQEPG